MRQLNGNHEKENNVEHTIEPQYDFETIDTVNERDDVPRFMEWVDDAVYQYINPHCSYCNAPIESNDPEYTWFHVGE